MIKINDENRIQIIEQYVDILWKDMATEVPRYGLYQCAMGFLYEEIMRLSNGDLEVEILEKHSDLLENYNAKIDNKNRTEVVHQYVNMLMTEVMEEMPRYKLYDYSRRFLLQEKTLLSNEYLEAEVLEKHSFLLDENNE
jgi:hypothetical protein